MIALDRCMAIHQHKGAADIPLGPSYDVRTDLDEWMRIELDTVSATRVNAS